MTKRDVSILSEFKDDLDDLPEAIEPSSTTLQIIHNRPDEESWQRLLFHYLSPNEPHGLDYALLNHILSALSNRDDLDFTFSRSDLTKMRIDQQVQLSDKKRPDAVTWVENELFICWELKTKSPEREGQTQDYVNADEFSSISLEKDSIPPDSHYYIFLAPDNYSSPDADEFVHIPWKWIARRLRSFFSESYGRYPARTTTQLHMFIETIQRKLEMTEYQESQQEKLDLYVDYYDQISKLKRVFSDEISELEQVFEERWSDFTNHRNKHWATRLTDSLEGAERITESDVPKKHIPTKITLEDGEQLQLVFWHNKSKDWEVGAIHPTKWWTNLEEQEPVYNPCRNAECARLSYIQRFSGDPKETAIEDRTLKFWLRNPRKTNNKFRQHFASRFKSDDKLNDLIPSRSSITGNKSNVLEAEYEININSHSGFVEAYVAALTQAMREHVVQNPELMREINSIYRRTIQEDTSFKWRD